MDLRMLRGLLVDAGPVAAAAAVGSRGARRAPEVYRRLDKPSWAPPGAAFAPVWSALYLAIGVAGGRLRRRRAGPAVLGLHAAQLALNAAWPFAFFAAGSRRGGLAVVAAVGRPRER